MNPNPPAFSIVIPVYNRERYVADTLRSVLAQQGDDFEVIVVDDGSTDRSMEIVEGFDDPRIVLVRGNHGGGAAARNLGIARARGEFIVWIDSDDHQPPNALAELRRAIAACPEADVYYGDLEIFDDAEPGRRWKTQYPDFHGVSLLPTLVRSNCLPNPGTAVRRSLYATHGGYDVRFTRCHDFHMWTRLADTARFKKVDAVLCRWRQHASSLSNTASRLFEARVAQDMLERYPPGRLYPDLSDDDSGRAEALARTAATVEALGEPGIALRMAYAAVALGATVDNLRALERKAGTSFEPAFTVVLTTFNRPRLLRDALDSLERQVFRDFDVVLVNDAGEEVENLLAQYSFRITYVRQPRNLGPAAARNTAHRLAAGEHLVYLDDDDLFLPDHLQTLADAMRRHPGKVVYTDASFITERIEGENREVLREESIFRHAGFSRERLSVDNYIPVNTFAWPRSLLPTVGGFDETMSGLEDWDFLLRLSAHIDFVHVEAATVQVRVRAPEAGPDERRSEQARRDSPALYRHVYSRHPDLGSEFVRKERARRLEALGIARGPGSGTTVQDWIGQRATTGTPCLADARNDTTPPAIGVLVIDRNQDLGPLRRTLLSLAPENGAPPGLSIVAIRACALAGDEPPLPLACQILVSDRPVAAALNEAAASLDCEWLIQVEAGEHFTPSGLAALCERLTNAPEGLRALYADEVMSDPEGNMSALLRPDLNLDLLLSAPSSMARHWCFHHGTLRAAGGFPEGHGDSHELALVLRLINDGGLAGIDHCAEPLLVTGPQVLASRQEEIDAILAHLHVRGYPDAEVESHLPGCYRIRYGHPDSPGVSIIVPTRNQFALLQRCVESLLEKTAYRNYEVIIVDNGSTDEDACGWLDGIEALGSMQLRVLRHPGEFDYAAMVNAAAARARGDYLLLLDNDTAIVREDWLDALVNHACRPEVGIVGARLLRADGTVDSAGLLLGLRGPCDSAFAGEKLDAPGYMYRLQVDQDYSAVSGSCLMVRRSVFDEVGGLGGGALRNAYSDLDLCLSVRQAGYLVVWTPHAVVLHEGGASRTREDRTSVGEKAAVLLEAQEAAYAKWLPALAFDPAYNRHLSLHGPAFALETSAWLNPPPREARPLPTLVALPADRFGCGYYRVIHPGRTMASTGLADVRIGDRYLNPAEMERLAPDAVVFQRQMLKDQIEAQRRMTKFSRAFKVAELDDYLPNVPLKSVHRNQLPQDVIKSMRTALRQMDRLVVSTGPLAEALHGMHPDIRVSRNRLPSEWWGQQQGRRGRGRKPRVGWAGGVSHRGDLEMVADVVEALSGEVEWVFMGMCPDKLRPFIHEFHEGVSILDYPAKLASLDLDLAIAPLEDNQFNRCKSNLRVLELGACGFPVVCSDVAAFQDGLPVTRVKPRFKDWTDAIRMHINDLDSAARAGDALREAIHRDWILDQASARAWLANWMPD